MKWIAALLLIGIGFLGGYAYSSYRAYIDVFTTLQIAQSLESASLSLRSVEMIDKGELVALRSKLLAVAEAELASSPSHPFNWLALLPSPLAQDSELVQAARAKRGPGGQSQ